MSDNPRQPPGARRSIRLLICGTVAGGILLLALLIVWAKMADHTRREQARRPWRQLRQLSLAMSNYLVAHGTLPYAENGPDHALYLLHPYIIDHTIPLRWNHDLQRLDEPSIAYLNEPGAVIRFNRFILMATLDQFPNVVQLASGDAFVTSHEFLAPPDRAILGSWRTADNFLASDEDVLKDWEFTHPSGASWSQTTQHDSAGSRPLRATAGQFSIEYRVQGRRLVGCVVTTPSGIIEEDVTTDRVGRLTSVRRQPDNWRELLP